MSESSRPFRFAVSNESVADLHARIDRTRWPDEVNDASWGYGVRMEYLKELVDHWRRQFDWRSAEARINALPQFLISIDGLDLHFVHSRSVHPQAMPLLITHGWPGSIVEFLELIPRLTEPERFGGRAEDAFHVVAPSLQLSDAAASSVFRRICVFACRPRPACRRSPLPGAMPN